MHTTLRSRHSLRYDRDAELLLIAEASRWLATAKPSRANSMESVMAILDRQQRVAACRALDRPIDA